MKLHAIILSILLVAGLASAGAQSAANYNIKGSVGYADTDLNSTTDDLNGLPGFSASDDESKYWSFEAGIHGGDNVSYGFEYAFYNSDASVSMVNLSAELADAINNAYGLTGSTPNFNLGYDGFMEDKVDLDSFMFILNYEYFLNEQFSILFKGGLGIVHVEETVKIQRDIDRAAGAAAPETLVDGSDSDTALAYQLGLNMCYYPSEAIALSVGVRYVDSGDMDFNIGSVQHTSDENDFFVYDLGVSYSF